MAYNDVEILRDKNGNPIPQYYNVATGQFEPLTGENGATHTQLTGSIVKGGYDIKSERYVNDVPANTITTVFDVQKAVIVDQLYFALNTEIRITFEIYNKSGSLMPIYVASFSSEGNPIGVLNPSLNQIKDGIYLFLPETHDGENGKYVYRIREPQNYPYGFRLRFQNTSSEAIQTAVAITYRELEE